MEETIELATFTFTDTAVWFSLLSVPRLFFIYIENNDFVTYENELSKSIHYNFRIKK